MPLNREYHVYHVVALIDRETDPETVRLDVRAAHIYQALMFAERRLLKIHNDRRGGMRDSAGRIWLDPEIISIIREEQEQ